MALISIPLESAKPLNRLTCLRSLSLSHYTHQRDPLSRIYRVGNMKTSVSPLCQNLSNNGELTIYVTFVA